MTAKIEIRKITVRMDIGMLINLKVIVAKKGTSIQKICHEFLGSYVVENANLI